MHFDDRYAQLHRKLRAIPRSRERLTELTMFIFCVLLASAQQPVHSTSKLSLARRDIGAATANGLSFFAGGCTTTGPGILTQFICDDASAVIDVVSSNGTLLAGSPNLTEARGWAAACSAGDAVVFIP